MALCYCLEAVDAENMSMIRHCLREWGWEGEGVGGREGGWEGEGVGGEGVGGRGDGGRGGGRERGWEGGRERVVI